MNSTKKQINQILNEVRPTLQLDGGDVALESFKNGIVTFKIKGACIGCPMARMTFEQGIGRIVKEKVKGVKDIRYE